MGLSAVESCGFPDEEMENNSSHNKKFICCGARSWSLVIGWVQTISSIVGLPVAILLLMNVATEAIEMDSANVKNETDSTEDRKVAMLSVIFLGLAVVIIFVILLLISLVSGIILILGVKQESVMKLKIWFIMQGVWLFFLILGAMLAYNRGGPLAIVNDGFAIFVIIFCIWMVNTHRHELMDSVGSDGSLDDIWTELAIAPS